MGSSLDADGVVSAEDTSTRLLRPWRDAAQMNFRPTPPLHLCIPLRTARGGGRRVELRGASRHPASRRLPSEVPLAVQLFPADGVTWVVSLPTGLAADTVWPDMEWIEALVEEVQAA